MHSSRSRPVALVLALGVMFATACGPGFQASQYPSPASLFDAGLEQLRAGRHDNAVQAFERLTLELPARDTLLPLAHYYLAQAYAGRGDHLLAAQSYLRLAEGFATDSLADRAMYRAGQEYQSMWRHWTLDPQYGQEATLVYQTLLGLYPDSPFADSAQVQLRVLEEWFASKDYENAMHYVRRRAYDSAIIYLRDVVERYPETKRAKDAYLRLAEAYDAIRYRDDKADVCAQLREKFPGDREVTAVCGRVTTTQVAPARADTL